MSRFIEEADSKQNKDVALAHRYLCESNLSCFPPAFEAAEEAATEYYNCVSHTDDHTEIQRSLTTIGTVHFERATSAYTTHFQRTDYAKKCRYFLSYN